MTAQTALRLCLPSRVGTPLGARVLTLVVLFALLGGTLLIAGCSRQLSTRSSGEERKTTVTFAFDVLDLRTDHQFSGQTNTFHVRYQYAPGLDGDGFDPKGHRVAENTYPYFQQVRTSLIDYVRDYPDKDNFYEVFGTDTAQHLMQRYPQLDWIDLTIDVPGYGGEPLPRTATIHVDR